MNAQTRTVARTRTATLRLLAGAAAAILLAAPSYARTDPVDSTVGTEKKGVPKAGGANVEAKVNARSTTGNGFTHFDFHGPETHNTPFGKNSRTQVISPNPFTHTYLGTETHGT